MTRTSSGYPSSHLSSHLSRPPSITTRLATARHEALVHMHRSALMPLLVGSQPVRSTLMLLPPAARRDASLDVGTTEPRVAVAVGFYRLSSFKDKRLARALEPFVTDSSWSAETREWALTTPNRDYVFHRKMPLPQQALDSTHARWLRKHAPCKMPSEFTLWMYVYAYVKSDSATCRVVVTGVKEKVVREEIKEIVCD